MTPKTAHAVCALSLVTEVVEDAGLTQPDLEDSTSLGEGDQRRQPEQKARDGEELGRVSPPVPSTHQLLLLSPLQHKSY